MIKLLHAADLHLGSRFRSLPPEKAAAMEMRQETLLRRLSELCRREECDLALIAGDLFDGAGVDTTLVRAMARCFEEMNIPVFISPGNHDHMGQSSPYDRVAWPENVHIFRRPTMESVALKDLNTRVWGAGYASMDCPPLLRDFTARGTERYQLGVLHGDPVVTASPYCPVTRGEAERSGLDYLALGHIHKAGKFTAGKTLSAWPGCPMGRGFHETGSKGVLVVTLDEAIPQLRFVDLGLGRFEELTVTVGDDPAMDILRALGADTQEDGYRVTLTGQREPVDTEKLYQTLADRFFLLSLVDETDPPVNLWASAGEDTLEGLYFSLLSHARDQAGEQEERILTLAAKISRRLLDGQEVKLP